MENDQFKTPERRDSFNPWLSIWVEPKATISKLVAEKNPDRDLLWLAAIYGFSSMLNYFLAVLLNREVGLFQAYFLVAVLSPIWGYIGFSIMSFFVLISGKVFRGAGSFKEIRAAYAWSCVPRILDAGLWIVMALVFGKELLRGSPDVVMLTQGQHLILLMVQLIFGISLVWQIVIYVIGLAVVQEFHVWKAICNILLAGLCFGLILGIILFLLTQGAGGTTALGPTSIITRIFFNLGN
jgi:hypothetical protein